MKSIIYDFETLGTDPDKSVVLALAMLDYDEAEFVRGDGYSYEELLSRTRVIKYDVVDQVKNHGRTIDPKTLEWWKGIGEEARKVLDPSSEDVSIIATGKWINDNFGDPTTYKKVFTRGNTFDPPFLKSIYKDPFNWWCIRDTRSYIEGLACDPTLDNRFIPKQYEEVFVHHAPDHDVVMDVMRMQVLVRAATLDSE